MPKKRQAVLLIHGIGEQRPMDTLRGFVKAVWKTDDNVKHNYANPGTFSRPDRISDSFELRLLTTTKNKNDIYTDFYELYWAHLMKGTQLRHVLAWAKRLLIRNPATVPPALRLAWWSLVILLVVIGFLLLQAGWPASRQWVKLPAWLIGALTGTTGAILAGVAIPILKNIVGDAARYLDPAPPNIASRQKIRALGVEILKKLHEAKTDAGTECERSLYDRIIVVGHSLGSVIGYDILTNAWPSFNEMGDPEKPHPELDATEKLAANGIPSLEVFRQQQRKLLDESVRRGLDWRVTDFLTLGSPLAHAEILMAKDSADLNEKKAERELPTCPPVLEDHLFSYRKTDPVRIPHHAALFGPTRWTNLYFPCHAVAFGDLIAGPMGKIFGPGIDDRPVSTKQRFGLFSHTLYWKLGRNEKVLPHIEELRAALNLLDD